LIATAADKTGMDIVVLTSDNTGGKESQAYADDFYDNNSYGTGDFNSGILYFIDMDNRVPTISTTGEMIDYINDNRLSSIFDAVDPYLQDSDWYGSAVAFLDKLTAFVAAGQPAGGYRYDTKSGQVVDEYGNPVADAPSRLTFPEVMLGLAVGAVVALIRYFSVSRKYKMKSSPYFFNLQTNAALNVVNNLDDFLRTSETRVPIANNSGGFGGGGGSGVHMGGSGTSHGGGSGRGF
jgi:uncharacterized protein